MRKTVSFQEYEAAKAEIIQGVEFKEDSVYANQYGMRSKTYSTEKNGNFYEVTNPDTGIVEFWSDKHPASRYYDSRSREEIIAHYEEIVELRDKLIATITENNKALSEKLTAKEKECIAFMKGMNENASMLIQEQMKVKKLERKLSAINSLSEKAVAT